MLIELRTENHRSIRDEQAISMEVYRNGDVDDLRPRSVEGSRKKLLPAAAIYGANASGKSNVVAALRYMRDAVIHSQRLWQPEGGVPRDAFAWGRHELEPSMFEVTFLKNGTRYQYGFVADDERFTEEWLYAWPRGRKQVWFERDGDSFRFGDSLHGENHQVERLTRPNALFLSAAVQHRHSQLTPIYLYFRDMRFINVLRVASQFPGPRSGISGRARIRRMLERILSRAPQETAAQEGGPTTSTGDTLLELLRAADVGILELSLRSGDSDWTAPGRRTEVMVRHPSSAHEAWLPLDDESQGTKTLLTIGIQLIEALQRGSLLVIDELEASLHPLLARHILQLFQDNGTNPKNAQLLFTTLDTNLLGTAIGEPALRRDQIWLTEKDNEGATCLYPLTDYKPRKSESLERGYLQGRYGAIPYLGDLARFSS